MLFKCERLYYQIYVMHPIPPPLNLPIALFSLTKRALRSAQGLLYCARGSIIPGSMQRAESSSLLDSVHKNRSEASSERANDGRQLVRKYIMQQERERTESTQEVAHALKSKLDELMRMHAVLASEIAENGASRGLAAGRRRSTVHSEQSLKPKQGGADDHMGKAPTRVATDSLPKHDGFFALAFFKIPAHMTKESLQAAVKSKSSIVSKLTHGLEASKQAGDGMVEGLAEGLRNASPLRATSSACELSASGDSLAAAWPSLVEEQSAQNVRIEF